MSANVCHQEKRWHAFLIPSVVIYLIGIIFILVYRLSVYLMEMYRKRKPSQQSNCFGSTNALSMLSRRLYNIFGKIVFGNSVIGKLLSACSGLFILASIVLYLIDTTRVPPAEKPMIISEEPVRVLSLICNIFFFIYFILKFMGSFNKLEFWLTLPTFADIFTVPPVFTELALGYQWIGMRFVCFFRILTFPDLFQTYGFLKTATQIRLSELLSIFLCVWLSGAGFIHMTENSGSPTLCYEDVKEISYWNSFYLVLITMSTVGYGDLYCVTIAGKIFIMIFIIIAVALFASFIPEIIEIVSSSREPYNIDYVQGFEVRHLIVGGSITVNSIRNFVEDFTHPDRAKNSFKSIIFDSTVPSPDILTMIKSMASKMLFIKGSFNNVEDLNRIKLRSAEAFIILTNLSSSSPDDEDMRNIMKMIASKKYACDVKVILQLIKPENKSICLNLPCWTENDQIICLTEINNGFMATGCLVPGFSTLITNLILLISKQDSEEYLEWQKCYMYGAEMEVYCVRFSKHFLGKPLNEVIEFCYKRFKLLLVGVSRVKDAQNYPQPRVILNPDHKLFITHGSIGFFFGPSEEDTNGVKYYCSKCHSNTASSRIYRCSCPAMGIAEQISTSNVFSGVKALGYQNEAIVVPMEFEEKQENFKKTEESEELTKLEREGELIAKATEIHKNLEKKPSDHRRMDSVDITGVYHWCAPRVLEECILPNSNKNEGIESGNHIILYSQELSPGSLRCFVLPLRTSSFTQSQMRTIVILVDDIKELEDEWNSISNFPLVYASVGNPMNRSVLRSLNINNCHMFVVMAGLSARMSLSDSQTILITLNTKSLPLIPSQDNQKDNEDLKKIIRKFAISKAICEKQIAILTEISDFTNIKYVDLNKTESDKSFFCTRPYACGRVFISRVFDTLTTSTFFFPETYKLVKVFITGTDSDEQEILQAEGISQTDISQVEAGIRDSTPRCTVRLLPLDSGLFKPYKNSTFGKLFLGVYAEYGIMCIGLYRLINLFDPTEMTDDRFVFTNPSPSMQLDSSDLVYCLWPQNLKDSSEIFPVDSTPTPKDHEDIELSI